MGGPPNYDIIGPGPSIIGGGGGADPSFFDGRYVHQDGTGLPPSVAIKSQVNTFAPAAVNADSLTITVPALDGVTGIGGLRMFDVAGTAGRMIQLNHSGGSGSFPYALEIRNQLGSGSALAIHQYSNLSPTFQLDSVQNVAMIQLKNAENAAAAAGVHGTSAYFDFRGYFVPTVSASDGVVAGGTNLTSASAAFVAEDAGKIITVAGVQNTIQTYVSATAVTLQNATANGSGITFSYVPKAQAESFSMATLTNDLRFLAGSTTTPFSFTTVAGGVAALRVTQPSGAQPALYVISGGTGVGVNLDNTGTGTGLFIYNRTASNALAITQTAALTAVTITINAGAAGYYPFILYGQNYGPQFTTSTDGGTSFTVNKNGTGAGTGVLITNAGTGLSLDVQAGGSKLQVNSTGVGLNGNAPVAKASAIASPTSDTVGTKAAIDAIRVALTNIGVTA